MLSKLFPCQIEAAYGITCDEEPYVQLPAGDRNAPLSITNGQAPELDSVPADAALDGPIQLPKLPRLTAFQRDVLRVLETAEYITPHWNLKPWGRTFEQNRFSLDRMVEKGLLTRLAWGCPRYSLPVRPC